MNESKPIPRGLPCEGIFGVWHGCASVPEVAAEELKSGGRQVPQAD
jgi:hypothetical protein